MKTNFTKKILFGFGLIFISAFSKAQNGLEKIIVEKYYVSNAADSIGSIGVLPVGSVTYRVFVDMLPGYNFQMAYGNANHPLMIKTTTSFFNNEDRGSTNPTYTKSQAKNNSVMLDSWLSVGAACVGNFGILKSEDNGVANVVNADGILANPDTSAGIPLTTQDGMIAVTGRTPGTFGTIGQVDSAITVFDATSQEGNSFIINDGSWFVLGGAVGPDSATNKVLIAQLTTTGILTLQLNIQIGTPTGGVENYVASNPTLYNGQMEITVPSLIDTLGKKDTTSHSYIKPISATNNIISIFPNPSKGIYTLNIKQTNSNSVNSNYYKVYDIIGNVLLNKRIENSSINFNETIDLSSDPTGIYFAEVSINGEKKMVKLIKE